MERCPHDEPDHQCPIQAYRNFKNQGLEDIAEICSYGNKLLMVNYHNVCNKIRTRHMQESITVKMV